MEENNNIRFPFSNKVVFSMVMQDAEKCRKLLERIFPHRKIRKVKVAEKDIAWKTIRGTEGVRSEMQILNDPYHKSIQLDVLFEDDENWYDIEMQVENADNIPKRSRYYHSMIDSVILSKGAMYSELRPCYVIFICCFDLFKKGEAVYCFENYDCKNHLPLRDGAVTIILNSKCSQDKVPVELTALFEYINEGKIPAVHDGFIEEIHQCVLELNQRKEMFHVISAGQEIKWLEDSVKLSEARLKEVRAELAVQLMEIEKAEAELAAQTMATEKAEAELAAQTMATEKAEAELAAQTMATEKAEAELAAQTMATEKAEAELAAQTMATEKAEAELAAQTMATEKAEAELKKIREKTNREWENGIRRERFYTAKKMKAEGISEDIIQNCTGLTESEIANL